MSGISFSGPSWDVIFMMGLRAKNLVKRGIPGQAPVPVAITTRVP